jgi:ankyrin repeat protein
MQIYYAAARGDLTRVKEELRRGVNVDFHDQSGQTPLMAAARDRRAGVEMIRLLLEHGADPNGPKSRENSKPLHLAVRGGNPAKVQALLEAGADVRQRTNGGYTALFEAASTQPGSEQIEIVDLLLKAGVQVKRVEVDSYHKSPLLVAYQLDHLELVRQFLEVGADPEPLQWTELHRAVAVGTLDEMSEQLALVSKPDLSARDMDGRTAWLLSLQTGDLAKARRLLEAGANPDERGPRGRSNLMYATSRDNAEVVRWLLEMGADYSAMDEAGYTVLMEAARQGATGCVRLLLDAGADPNENQHLQVTPLTLAANPEIVRLLVESGADINYVDGLSYSRLKQAAERGEIEMARALLEMEADPDRTNLVGETPLFRAALSDQLEIMQLLLGAGANPNAVDVDDWTPICQVHSIEAARLLLKAGQQQGTFENMLRQGLAIHKDPDLVAYLGKVEANPGIL